MLGPSRPLPKLDAVLAVHKHERINVIRMLLRTFLELLAVHLVVSYVDKTQGLMRSGGPMFVRVYFGSYKSVGPS